GGINLEDIKAPECFEIETRLKAELKIPVFHDDQHGTAIICAAAFMNACEITKRKPKSTKVVFNGAGAASIACAKLLLKLGVALKNITMCDSKGIIHTERTDLNEYKEQFAVTTKKRTLSEAVDGSDVFIGLSVAGVMTPDMLKTMNKKPIVFAMANPDPEILPPLALATREDVIMATGRSDFPNQVNNVLGFPSIFRGALDVRATCINEEMKLAAVHALADLAREDVPESVSSAYDNRSFHFGPDYIIPKPFDPRVIMKVAPAVAKAAMDSGVAQKKIESLKAYEEQLEALQGFKRSFIRTIINRVKSKAKGKELPILVFPEGRSSKILKALATVQEEKVIQPLILGHRDSVLARMKELEVMQLQDIPIIAPIEHPKYQEYTEKFYHQRKRKGVMHAEAERLMSDPYFFSAMMVQNGDANGLISGATHNYADCVRPILQIIGTGRRKTASGLNIVIHNGRFIFFADTTVNIDPTADQLATIAIHASRVAAHFNLEPRIAMLSYSNFTGHPGLPDKMQKAVQIVQERYPNLIVDGEMQADTAVNPKITEKIFPFCNIKGGANVLVFPNLAAGNIGYKLVQQLGGGEVLGPFLMGVKKPANVLQRTCTVDDVINTIILTALEAQAYQERVTVQ
ncbi:MAG: NADP-dependent malic enzyme, partial [Bdellovibrionales bacterium]|nr:NADP-dependent malic enzyme [Bdellovibrionales bacterium]